MNKIFWTVVAVDAALFMFLLISGLTESGNSSGGREMGLAFYVILPGIFIGLAVLLYVRSSSMVAAHAGAADRGGAGHIDRGRPRA